MAYLLIQGRISHKAKRLKPRAPEFLGAPKIILKIFATVITVNRGFCKWRSSATAPMWMKDNEQEVCPILHVVFFHPKPPLVLRLVSRLWHTQIHTAESHRILWCPWLHYYRLSAGRNTLCIDIFPKSVGNFLCLFSTLQAPVNKLIPSTSLLWAL